MTSTRIILVFLGFIFLVIIILSSNKIGAALRAKLGKFLPSVKPPYEQISPTPTLIPTFTPTPTIQKPNTISNGKNTTPSNEIPATGPESGVYIVLGGSLILGLTLKKYASIS